VCLINFNPSPQPSHFHICCLSTVYWETMDEDFTLASTSWCNIIVQWQRDKPRHEYDRHDFSCVWHCYHQSCKHLHSALTICYTTPTQPTVYRQHAAHGTVLRYPQKSLKWEKAFNPLNTKLNPICHLLALLGAHPIFHVRRLRVKPFPWKSWDKTKKNFGKLWAVPFWRNTLLY
jgi:hypothetical protein